MKLEFDLLKKGDVIQITSYSSGNLITCMLKRIERKWIYGKCLIRFEAFENKIIPIKKDDTVSVCRTVLTEKLNDKALFHYEELEMKLIKKKKRKLLC